MRSVQKVVFYCDYCGIHRISRTSMEKHEPSCTKNPARVCRWRIDGHSDGTRVVEIEPLAAELRRRAVGYQVYANPEAKEETRLEQADIDWLHDEVSGCPACMLAALRQSGVDEWHSDREFREIFSYEKVVDALRAREREAESVGW